MADLGGIRFDDDPHKAPLSGFRLPPRQSFRYEYDFTAHWRVDIRREEILPQPPRVFAVGDIRAGSVKRVASAVGEGSMAVQFVHRVLAEWCPTAGKEGARGDSVYLSFLR